MTTPLFTPLWALLVFGLGCWISGYASGRWWVDRDLRAARGLRAEYERRLAELVRGTQLPMRPGGPWQGGPWR